MKFAGLLILMAALIVVGSTTRAVNDYHSPSQQQQQPTPTPVPPTATPSVRETMEFGSTIEVNTSAGASQISFTVDRAQFVNIIATSGDGVTDPLIYLYTANERLMALSDDYTAIRDDLADTDALIEDSFLIPGTYQVRIEGTGGNGTVNLTVEPGTGGVLGTGRLTIIRAQIGEGERFAQTLNLQENELISLMVISESETLDPRIQVRDAQQGLVARNDDAETFDVILDATDAKIENLIVPANGEYTVEIRAFSAREFGTFLFIIQRYGTLEPVVDTPEVLTGTLEQRERQTFPLELEAGEVISVTARATGKQLDPQIALIDPDNIIVVSNDDHGTNATDIGTYDARFSNYIVQKDGAFNLTLESVGGRGSYEMTVTRSGKLNPGSIGAPIDTTANRVFIPPTAIPTVPAEATAEATPAS